MTAFGDDALNVVGGKLRPVHLAGLVEAAGRWLVHSIPRRPNNIRTLRIALLKRDQNLIALLRKKEEAASRTGVRREQTDPRSLTRLLPVVLHPDPPLQKM